jgi:prepilin-type processing-associated H-X9-DG protein
MLGSMEQQPLYNAMNFSLGCDNGDNYAVKANSTIPSTKLSVFLCPSSSAPTWLMTGTFPLSTIPAPGNSYFASLGSSLEFDATMTGGPPNGLFAMLGTGSGVVSLAAIVDGTSNTIAFGEWKFGSGNKAVETPATDVVALGSYPSGTSRNTPTMSMPNPTLVQALPGWLSQCTAALPTARTNKGSCLGETWAIALPGLTLGNVVLPPNSTYPNCVTTTKNSLDFPGVFASSSFHPGGANFLMADGSVRFLKNSVSQSALWALGSRNQGEVISGDAY